MSLVPQLLGHVGKQVDLGNNLNWLILVISDDGIGVGFEKLVQQRQGSVQGYWLIRTLRKSRALGDIE
jgi:hypothetical protein